jgi:putative alpha-1,2-mannosidase
VFTKATIHLPHGDFVIDAPDASVDAKYIQSATFVDDKGDSFPLSKTWFTHGDIRKGASLTFEMGPVPNTEWGTSPEAAPPSLSTHSLHDFACGAGIRSENGGN